MLGIGRFSGRAAAAIIIIIVVVVVVVFVVVVVIVDIVVIFDIVVIVVIVAIVIIAVDIAIKIVMERTKVWRHGALWTKQRSHSCHHVICRSQFVFGLKLALVVVMVCDSS